MKTKLFPPFLLAVITVFILSGFPLCAVAGEPTEQVRETVDEVINILNDKELKKPEREKDRKSKIRKAVLKRFDFEEMAKRSLAVHWRDRTPAEQKEFVALFTDLLEDTYIRKVERYENEKVIYLDERIDGAYATVKTKIVDTKGTGIPVDYRIIKKKEKWDIYDIIVEGVSLVNNYRTQFAQIMRSASYEALVKRLKEKVGK